MTSAATEKYRKGKSSPPIPDNLYRYAEQSDSDSHMSGLDQASTSSIQTSQLHLPTQYQPQPQPQPQHTRRPTPALITKNDVGSNTAAHIVGDMVFDPQRLCWCKLSSSSQQTSGSSSNGNGRTPDENAGSQLMLSDEEDVFAEFEDFMSDDDDDGRDRRPHGNGNGGGSNTPRAASRSRPSSSAMAGDVSGDWEKQRAASSPAGYMDDLKDFDVDDLEHTMNSVDEGVELTREVGGERSRNGHLPEDFDDDIDGSRDRHQLRLLPTPTSQPQQMHAQQAGRSRFLHRQQSNDVVQHVGLLNEDDSEGVYDEWGCDGDDDDEEEESDEEEEFDLGPKFIRRQRAEEERWRKNVNKWVAPFVGDIDEYNMPAGAGFSAFNRLSMRDGESWRYAIRNLPC